MPRPGESPRASISPEEVNGILVMLESGQIDALLEHVSYGRIAEALAAKLKEVEEKVDEGKQIREDASNIRRALRGGEDPETGITEQGALETIFEVKKLAESTAKLAEKHEQDIHELKTDVAELKTNMAAGFDTLMRHMEELGTQVAEIARDVKGMKSSRE